MNQKPVRIAHIIGKLNAAGVEAVVNNYYRNIDHTKYQFDYFIDADSSCEPPQELIDMGARYFVIPPYRKLSKHMSMLIKLFKENKYQIVHSGMNTLAVFSLCAAWIAGVPVRINHNHSTASKEEGKRVILKYVLRPFATLFATNYLACSEHAGRWLFSDKRYDHGDVMVLNNAIDFKHYEYDAFVRTKVREQLGISAAAFVVGHVGRFMLQKNHSYLIDIFAEVVKHRADAKLLLVGDGELRSSIIERIRDTGLEDNVIFMGAQNDVAPFYQAMDIFCFPSIFEGLGLVAIEAQACSLPVIASTKVPKEIVISENVQFIDLSNEPEVWAQAILQHDGVNRANAYLSNDSGFDIKVESKKLEQYYDNVSNKSK